MSGVGRSAIAALPIIGWRASFFFGWADRTDLGIFEACELGGLRPFVLVRLLGLHFGWHRVIGLAFLA